MDGKRVMHRTVPIGLAGAFFIALVATTAGQPGGAVKVTIKDGKIVTGTPTVAAEGTPRIQPAHGGSFPFGLKVDNKRITCSEQGSIWCMMRVDGQEVDLGFAMQAPQPPKPLPASKNGKPRHGFESLWVTNDLRVTQTVEVIPSRPVKTDAGLKRPLDTCRISYVVENISIDARPRKIEMKAMIDILINNNDGALYASPTTHPGKVLNGIALKGKNMPEYVQVLERPDVQNPGMVAAITLKHGKADGPSGIILTNLGVVSNGWEPMAQPAGDSACAILWDAKEIKGGEKREMVWAYGGGIASDPESEGRVAVSLGGSFEPNKLFTITAHVDDPVPNQALTLVLPEGMQRVEGREIQPVPVPGDSGSSVVLWKARVLRLGDHEIKVRSSTGVTQIKNVNIQAN